jgi:hypothetical protein
MPDGDADAGDTGDSGELDALRARVLAFERQCAEKCWDLRECAGDIGGCSNGCREAATKVHGALDANPTRLDVIVLRRGARVARRVRVVVDVRRAPRAPGVDR